MSARAFISPQAETVSAFTHLLDASRDFIEMLPVASYACDASGRILWFNRRAAALWGRLPPFGEREARYCAAFRLLVDGRPCAPEESPMARALASGEAIEGVKASLERPDGTRIWISIHVEPVKDAAGRVVGAVNCFHDMTGENAARDQADDTEARFRQLLEALPAAVYTTDAEGRITYYNPAAVAMSGRTPTLGSDKWCVTWRLFMPDGTPLPHDECPMAVALKEGRAIRNVEAVAERPDGTMVPFLPYPTPIRDRAGKVVGAVNMLVDISERKEAENRQLVLLRELNHRVKNNMHMLQALLMAAQRESASPEARAVLADTGRRVSAMAAAQRGLYDDGKPGGFDAKGFLESVCANSQNGFAGDVNIVIDAASGTLSNDMVMPLALILNELLTNAVKHGINGKGAGTIHVGLSREGDAYQLQVADAGPGFDLDATVRRRASGLGLVNGLARQLGGSFRVERANGARCIVRFQERQADLH